jgi:hypothetical protein
MLRRYLWLMSRPMAAGLAALAIIAGPAWGQKESSTSSSHDQSKNNNGEVVRTFGTEGGYRTQVASRTTGSLTEEDRRQLSLLMAQVLEHLEEARDALDADETKEALEEVNKGLEAIKTVRSMLPRTTVRVRTLAPGDKVAYEDERVIQDGRIPIYEGMPRSSPPGAMPWRSPASRWSRRRRS